MEFMKSPIVKVLILSTMMLVSLSVKAQYILTNPLEWMALAEGNELINGEIKSETRRQMETAVLQNTMSAEFTKIHEWEKKYSQYLRTADGYASTLRAATTLYHDGVGVFITLGKLSSAIRHNPSGIIASMSMNNLYLETATELVTVFTMLKDAVAVGGEQNMLTGAERSQTLWALQDKLHTFGQKLRQLYMSIRFYTMSDVWNQYTAGMFDTDNGRIARQAKSRWKRAARSIHF